MNIKPISSSVLSAAEAPPKIDAHLTRPKAIHPSLLRGNSDNSSQSLLEERLRRNPNGCPRAISTCHISSQTTVVVGTNGYSHQVPLHDPPHPQIRNAKSTTTKHVSVTETCHSVMDKHRDALRTKPNQKDNSR
eukprot:1379285-Amphidinium_carterae.2